ncbi:MAG: hypothetical protein CVV42_06765 [Candidatus Riflebacteria bacterium HGW-Riflebacteria-2]|jgi:hypothetical protein|nr:MAG: hypothetical protein CVV42_06765 [Candidatus Riflebacteria bacterium HGW-Riflebacteria-2]
MYMKKFFVFCLAFLLAFGFSSALLAQDATTADSDAVVSEDSGDTATTAPAKEENKDKKEFKGKGRLEQIETSGVLKVTPADASKNQKYATILLVCGDKEYKLLPGLEKTGFAELEKMDGQTVTVKGGLMPATEKYPLPAIKVDHIPGVSKAGDKPLKGEPTGKGKARKKM